MTAWTASRLCLVLACCCVSACRSSNAGQGNAPSATSSPRLSAPAIGSSTPAPSASPPALSYPWKPTATDRLALRFSAPPGFARVQVPKDSFASFLRDLPLLPDSALVVDYLQRPLYNDGRHPNIAAVIDIDVGTQDLQQCADAILRLHAEWRYGSHPRSVQYRLASGVALSYAQYLEGQRLVTSGNRQSLKLAASPVPESHAVFRSYLDTIFAWANTASIERDGSPVPIAQLQAGDYFVMRGNPVGHAVIVLDVARNSNSSTLAVLLGQSYMPAQSVHVLKPTPAQTWFLIEPDITHVSTPFWQPFPLTSLRRLP